MPKTSLDAIDRKILKYLIKNARMPFLEIARECGISGAAIHQHIRKLDVEAHFITGSGNILVKLYCVDNEHLMRTIFDGILRIQGVASTETQISLQEAFQRQVNIDFIEE